MSSLSENSPCPCGSGQPYLLCCQPYLLGDRLAGRAELLMRSRYTAYVGQDEAYLLATWHPDTRPVTLHLDQEQSIKWLGLSVKRALEIDSQHAEVEFVARYKINGRAFRMHEVSRFDRIDGRWFYLGGVVK